MKQYEDGISVQRKSLNKYLDKTEVSIVLSLNIIPKRGLRKYQ